MAQGLAQDVLKLKIPQMTKLSGVQLLLICRTIGEVMMGERKKQLMYFQNYAFNSGVISNRFGIGYIWFVHSTVIITNFARIQYAKN